MSSVRYSDAQTFSVDAKLLEVLCPAPWRGNVRELELFTRKLLVLKARESLLCFDGVAAPDRGEDDGA